MLPETATSLTMIFLMIKLKVFLLVLFCSFPLAAENVVPTGVSDIYLNVKKVTYETEEVTIALEVDEQNWKLKYAKFTFADNTCFELKDLLHGVFEPSLQETEIKQIGGEEFLILVRVPFYFYEPIEKPENEWVDKSLLLDIYVAKEGIKEVLIFNQDNNKLVKKIK